MKKYSDRIRRINEASEQQEAYNALIKLLGKEKGPRIQHIGNNRLAIYTDAEYPTIVKVEGFFKEQLNEAVSEDVVLSIYHDLDTEHPDEKIETVDQIIKKYKVPKDIAQKIIDLYKKGKNGVEISKEVGTVNEDHISSDILKGILPDLKFDQEGAYVDGNHIFVPFNSIGARNNDYLKKVRSDFEESLKKALKKRGISDYNVKLDTSKTDRFLSGWFFKIEDSSDKSINESTYPTYKDIDGDTVYKLPVKAKNIEELISLAQKNDELDDFLRGELGSSEGVQTKDGNVFWGSDIQDFLPKRKYEDHIEDRAGQMEFILKNSEQYNKKQLDAMTDEEVKDVYMAVEASMEEMR